MNDFEEGESISYKLKSFTSKLIHLKYWPLILAISVLILVYLSYFAFAVWQAVPEVELYTPFADEDILRDNYLIAANTVREKWVTWPIQLFMVLSILFVLFVALILNKKKKLNWKYGLILILVLAAIITIGYGLYNDNITSRQYDVWSDNNYFGHYGITMYIFKNGKIPPAYEYQDGFPSIEESYQLYHPKFSYLTYAGFMHINSLFLNNDWSLYQANRILTISMMIMTLYVEYKIIQEANLTNKGKFVMGLIVLLCPVLFRLAGQSNNDPFVILFMMLAIYFSIRWYKNHTFFNIIMIALSIGFAMSSKLSGSTIAIITAAIFLYILIKRITRKDLSINICPLICQFVVFALIVFPLGLFWPIYNFVKYQQPFNYVFFYDAPGYSTDKYSIFERIGYFNLIEYFQKPYIITSQWSGTGFPIDGNLYSTTLKMFFYGEFGISNNYCLYNDAAYWVAYIIDIVAFIAFIAFCFSAIYSIIKLIIEKISFYKEKMHHKIMNDYTYIMSFIFILFLISEIIFIIKYPHVSSYDMRYYLPIILPIGFLISKALENLSVQNNNVSKIANISVFGIFATLNLFVIIFYVVIGTYPLIAI